MQALIDELKKPEYQGMSDAQAAAAINAKVVPVRIQIDCWMAKQHALENGYYASILKASQQVDHPARDLCISVLAYIDDSAGKFLKIDLDRPKVQEMLATLVLAGFVSPELRWELDSLADSHEPWVVSVGLGKVGDGTIRSAREMISYGIA